MDAKRRYSEADEGDNITPFEVEFDQHQAEIKAQVTDDRRIAIDLERQSRIFSKATKNDIQKEIDENSKSAPPPYEDPEEPEYYTAPPLPHFDTPAALNIVIQIVGSRGDVQPFVTLGQRLKSRYNHRIRVATHPIFKSFVESNGLEFFSIGGNPQELMAFMVRSPGLLPSFESLKRGDVGRQRKMVAEMVEGCWRACIEEGDGMIAVEHAGKGKKKAASERSFVADAIIANPPSFAHIHCGQKLGIPVHLMFTMPWTSTQSFPHPLANIKTSSKDLGVVNYVSYALVETLMWQGLGSVQNRFRQKVLGLEPVRLSFGPRILSRLKIPHTYCWSDSLIPKPQDWGAHISVAGFYFMDQPADYAPDPALLEFLHAGEAPIYVGFGSIVVSNPEELTNTLLAAIEMAGVRAIVSKGWSGIGAQNISRNVFLVGDVPHDWLFQQVAAVVHHGGAGTTAASIAAGKPSVIVPFFGDQFFWGDMVKKCGIGSAPIPAKSLTSMNLAAAISEVLQIPLLERASTLGQMISREEGTENGCVSLHHQTEIQCQKCVLIPSRVAVWRLKKRRGVRLSALAATVLLNAHLLKVQDLKLLRHLEYDVESGPWDPITGVISSCLGMVGDMAKSLGDVPAAVKKADISRPRNGTISRASLNVAQGTLVGTSKGVGRILLAGFRSPFEVMLLAARGFHNAPALYGDKSVRPPERITGLVSGFEAMGKEIGYSLYDSISGLFLHPIDGARRNGLAGFSKGLGIGLMGFCIKPIAAVWGVGGYTYEGLNKELEKLFGSSIEAHIALARLAQGSSEFNAASDEVIAGVFAAWQECVVDVKKGKERA